MEFGVFDHLDRSVVPLPEFYEGRLALTEAYDRGGFYAYHIAEHHSTPLGLAPSPGVFLSAVAQRTKRLRFGPLIYMLPLYHPLRLIEEICMLDQLSGGRYQIGVGRGISPFETAYYGQDYAAAPKIFAETLAILLQGLTAKTLDFEGAFYRFRDVPMELEPKQKPHPPLWYGVHSASSAEENGRRGYNIITLDPAKETRLLIDRYRAGWQASHGGKEISAKLGMSRFIVLAESDAEARAIAGRAYPKWHKSFNHLYRLHGKSPMLGERPADFAGIERLGTGIAGAPNTVLAVLRAQIEEAQINYLVGQFAFGDVSQQEALRSIELFTREVMPGLQG